jgi:hypothetical protein
MGDGKGIPAGIPAQQDPGWLFNNKQVTQADFQQVPKKKVGWISEGFGTLRLIDELSAEKVKLIAAAMTLPPDAEPALQDKFVQANPFPPEKPTSPTVLVLHRDTGKNLGGAYPELDTGEGLWDLLDILEATENKQGTAKLKTVLCGDVTDRRGISPSIGRYWETLKALVPSVTQRDIETFFFKWAYEQGYFHMVAGFRSGQLDMFTLLGIPTVSIGLRNLVGEDRHVLLAKGLLQRVVAEYDLPRSRATAWIKGHQWDGKPQVIDLLHSPYWLEPAPANVKNPRPRDMTDPQKLQIISVPPSGFGQFDKWVIQVAIRIACERYLMGWGKTVEQLVSIADVVNTRNVKQCCLTAWKVDKETLTGAWTTLYDAEQGDLLARLQRAEELQEPETIYLSYKKDSAVGWPAVGWHSVVDFN